MLGWVESFTQALYHVSLPDFTETHLKPMANAIVRIAGSISYLLRFFSNLVGEEGSRIPGFTFGYARQARGQGFQGLFSNVIHDFLSSISSTIFEGIETTDLLICKVRPYLSSFGNFSVIIYI